jgi:hypothetical protein
MIAWFGHGPLSHVDAVMPDGNLLGSRSDHMGGRPPGVQIRPPGYARFALTVCFEIETLPNREVAFWGFLDSQLGKPYDSRAILGFVSGRNWREQDSWICSELISAGLETALIFHPLYLAASKIDPSNLAMAVSAIGGIHQCTV